MNAFAFFCLASACLLQSTYGQCLRGAYTPTALPTSPCWDTVAPVASYAGALGAPLAGSLGYKGLGYELGYDGLGYNGLGYKGACGSYGGAGIGNVAVAGELPVAGTTAVAGQVPIIGAVEFGGKACAAGGVSIAGSCGCGCGCGSPYIY